MKREDKIKEYLTGLTIGLIIGILFFCKIAFAAEEEVVIPEEIEFWCEKYGEEYNICPETLEAMCWVESRCTPSAQSDDKKCKGLMQINPYCHREKHIVFGKFKAEPETIPGYYLDKNSVYSGVTSMGFPLLRYTLIQEKKYGKDYAWDRYKNKMYRWVPTLSQWWYNDTAVLYPRNLKYIPNAEMLKQITKEGQEISLGRWCKRMTRGSIYEKLANAGFTRLLIQSISDYNEPECDDSTELHKALRIDKMRLKRLKAMNGGTSELDWLRTEKKQNTIWPDEMIRLFSDAAYSPVCFDFIDAYMTYPQIWEYLKKQYKAYGYTWDYTITCWRDYMNMAAKLKIPMIERNYKPKDVRIAHNEVRDMLQGKDIENEARRIDRKWKKLKKVYPKLSKYEYAGKDYQIIAPKSTGDIVREGMILKHCVHTCDYYFDRISTNESYILFLRKAADPKQPYYTLELMPL